MPIENPQIAYRYRAINLNSVMEASTSSFYLSEPKSFNDPFDCNFYWEDGTNKDYESHLETHGRSINEKNLLELNASKELFEKALRNEIDKLGIACFTTDNLNPLMWSHYADGHKGICLGYKREDVLTSSDFRKVKYDRPAKIMRSSLELGKNMDKLGEFFEDVVYRKPEEWRYENEWRLMQIRPTKRYVYMPSPVESVTFGLKCPSDEMEKVLNILRIQYFSGVTKFYNIRVAADGSLDRVQISHQSDD